MHTSPLPKLATKHYVFFAFSFLALILSHTLWIRYVPGLQFDEGWYGIFAHRIAHEPGFWPRSGNMTSYTSALPHYFTAFFFKIFGTSLLVYRAVGVFQVAVGVLMISAGFYVAEQRRAAVIFPAVVAFFPALVINQRWVVELTTYCAMTTGMIGLGLALRWKRGPSFWAYALILSGAFLGVTAHIVYIAPVLAMWLCMISAGAIRTFKDRFAAVLGALILVPFFLHVFLTEEDKAKGVALLSLPFVMIAFHAVGPKLSDAAAKVLPKILVLPTALGCALFFPLSLFMEGNWLAKFSNGFIENSNLMGLGFIAPAVAVAYWGTSKKPLGLKNKAFRSVAPFLPIALLIVYAMVIKAGPRYLEAHFLFVAGVFTMFLARLDFHGAVAGFVLHVVLGSAVLGWNYFLPSIEERQEDHVFHFWRWRDGSGGFLPKIRLMKRLAAEGCTAKNIGSVEDGSSGVALEFLAIGDWPKLGHTQCRIGRHIDVLERRDQRSPDISEKRQYAEGPFWLVGRD